MSDLKSMREECTTKVCCLLISSPMQILPLQEVLNDFIDLEGEALPFRKCG